MKAKPITHIKIRIYKSLGIVRRIEQVEVYYSKIDALNCTLKGNVYPVIQARQILKKYEK